MIVDDLILMRIACLPTETDAPLVVDADAHLSDGATFQHL
jgi:hypothetical protein